MHYMHLLTTPSNRDSRPSFFPLGLFGHTSSMRGTSQYQTLSIKVNFERECSDETADEHPCRGRY